MSAPIGSAFAPISTYEKIAYKSVAPLDPETLQPVKEIEEPIIVYRIKNQVTGKFWSNGRWRKNGKVYLRKCDVSNSLFYMSHITRPQAIVVEYNLVPKDSILVEKRILVDEIVTFYTNTIKNFYEVLKKIS